MVLEFVRCRWCEQEHTRRYLCDPADQLLLALYARGAEGNRPPVELPEPLPIERLGLGLTDDDALVSQLLVEAAVVPFVGVPRPALMISGRSVHSDRPLPRWLFVSDDDGMEQLTALVRRMTEVAVKAAHKHRDTGA